MREWLPKWDKDRIENKSLSAALAEQLEADIRSGVLLPGDRLPPQRQLADSLGVNLSTVTRAFRQCEMKGLIHGVTGRGTFVSADAKVSLSMVDQRTHDGTGKRLIEMGQVFPLYTLDHVVAQEVKQITAEMDMARLMRYAEPAGLLKHRETGAEWLKHFGLSAAPESVVITPGSQNAIASSFLTLFAPGDRLAVDVLTYPGIKSLAALHGIRLVGVEMDEAGMKPEALAAACKNDSVRGVYLMPEFQNPTTRAMDMARREALAAVIVKNGLILIEDDAYAYTGELERRPLSALVPNQSIYIGSTSKLLGPGFRVSFTSVAEAYREALKKGVYNTTWMASPMTAEIVCQLIERGSALRLMAEKAAEARWRNACALEVLKDYQIDSRPQGFFQWLHLPAPWAGQAAAFEWVARESGVQVFCAEKFAVGSGAVPQAIRLALSGPETREDLILGLKRIRMLLEKNHESEFAVY